jgi:hypothetical protein
MAERRLLPLINAIAERCAAVAFSATIRRYSAGEHFPLAIIVVRWRMVSRDAAVRRPIDIATASEEVERRFLIPRK